MSVIFCQLFNVSANEDGSPVSIPQRNRILSGPRVLLVLLARLAFFQHEESGNFVMDMITRAFAVVLPTGLTFVCDQNLACDHLLLRLITDIKRRTDVFSSRGLHYVLSIR